MIRKSNKLIIVLLLLAIAGCATSLSLRGKSVDVTEYEGDVEGCEALGEVVAKPPFMKSDSHEIKLRNEAGKLGADVVLITEMGVGNAHGQAYDCGGKYDE